MISVSERLCCERDDDHDEAKPPKLDRTALNRSKLSSRRRSGPGSDPDRTMRSGVSPWAGTILETPRNSTSCTANPRQKSRPAPAPVLEQSRRKKPTYVEAWWLAVGAVLSVAAGVVLGCSLWFWLA